MRAIVFAARAIVPFHAQPEPRRAGDRARVADCAEGAGVGDALADARRCFTHGRFASLGTREGRMSRKRDQKMDHVVSMKLEAGS